MDIVTILDITSKAVIAIIGGIAAIFANCKMIYKVLKLWKKRKERKAEKQIELMSRVLDKKLKEKEDK